MAFLPIETLRCYDVVAIAVLMFTLDIAMHLWNQRGTQLSPQETALLKQYNDQVAIVNRLNSVETFVEQSKAIRKMNTVKKQMQELAGVLLLLTHPLHGTMRAVLCILLLGVGSNDADDAGCCFCVVERMQKAAPSNLQKRINQVRTVSLQRGVGVFFPSSGFIFTGHRAHFVCVCSLSSWDC